MLFTKHGDMTRKVFFSFHYERDAWRAGIVRNSGITKEIAGFSDAADWEKIASKGETAITNWIDDQLKGTSVTVVLIGAETNTRPYVKYELKQSWVKDNGILGIHIHQIKDSNKQTDIKGGVDFGINFIDSNKVGKSFAERFSIYDWVNNDGYRNFDSWIESAAEQVGK